MTSQISERLKSEYQNEVDLDRGSRTFSTTCDNDTVDEMCFEDMTCIIDNYETIGQFFENTTEVAPTLSEVPENSEVVDFTELGTLGNDIVDLSKTAEDLLTQDSEEIVSENLTMFLEKLLAKLGIGIDYIYKATDQSLAKLGSIIKKKIKKGEVTLTETELDLVHKALEIARK